MITIRRSEDDDPGFLDHVRSILAGCLDQYRPAEVYVVRIRDWFDYKWCYFSGKVLGALGVSKFRDLTLPPFVPNRVLSQGHYDRVATDGNAYEPSEAPPLHIRQESEANLRRFARRTTNDGLMMWFSSGSMATGRGSIMVYSVSPDLKFGWHVTLLRKAEWRIEKVTFTARSLVEGLRELGSRKIAAADDSPAVTLGDLEVPVDGRGEARHAPDDRLDGPPGPAPQ